MTDTPDNKALKEDEARAIEYVQGLKAFYQHLFFFIFFAVIFFAVIFFGGIFLVHRFIPVYMQFLAVGWSVGLVFHGLNAFEVINILGPAWERKKIEKRLGRKL